MGKMHQLWALKTLFTRKYITEICKSNLSECCFWITSVFLPVHCESLPGNEETATETIPAQGTCEPLTLTLCQDVGYENTFLPNFFNHTEQSEADLHLQRFSPLILIECSADLKPFLCSMFVPKCIPGESSPELPSKEKCQSARSGCEPLMVSFGFAWPDIFDCDKLPGSEPVPEPEVSTDLGEFFTHDIAKF